jgi:hypothetical protein
VGRGSACGYKGKLGEILILVKLLYTFNECQYLLWIWMNVNIMVVILNYSFENATIGGNWVKAKALYINFFGWHWGLNSGLHTC